MFLDDDDDDAVDDVRSICKKHRCGM